MHTQYPLWGSQVSVPHVEQSHREQLPGTRALPKKPGAQLSQRGPVVWRKQPRQAPVRGSQSLKSRLGSPLPLQSHGWQELPSTSGFPKKPGTHRSQEAPA